MVMPCGLLIFICKTTSFKVYVEEYFQKRQLFSDKKGYVEEGFSQAKQREKG